MEIQPTDADYKTWSKSIPDDGDLVFASRDNSDLLRSLGSPVMTAEQARAQALTIWTLDHRSWYGYALHRADFCSWLPTEALEGLPRKILLKLAAEQVRLRVPTLIQATDLAPAARWYNSSMNFAEMRIVSKLVAFICLLALSSADAKAKTVVNDVTKLNPIEVVDVVAPTTTEEIKAAILNFKGKISIGGGRYSMGGQTALGGSRQIDMRSFARVLSFDVPNKKITVQAGMTWRDLQEQIDKQDLSVEIMQTYSNFTVGGSLSVNAHGRYIGAGPIVNSVDSFKLILASGEEVEVSREKRPDLFFGAIGGYGALGVISEVTLNLVPNERLRRETIRLPVTQYRKYFEEKIRSDKSAVLHNGTLLSPTYKEVSLETWYHTDKPVTMKERLTPRDQRYWLAPTAISSISTLPFGSAIKTKILETLATRNDVVGWRNYVASYDVALIEPSTPRWIWTYVLQEYFIPVDRFEEFIPRMKAVFDKHNVNVVNVSIRHATKDPGTLMPWAPTEVYSFVVYYKQRTTQEAKQKATTWSRELIDHALALGGRYYLPYQLNATPEQFQRAYPGFKSLMELKKKVDPAGKFSNSLLAEYLKDPKENR